MMGIELRLALVIGSLFCLVYFMLKIRKNHLQIDYAIFWSLFSSLLLLIAIFPQIINWLSSLLGIISPANLVFLLIIFLLIIRLFSITVKLSKLENQIASLTQHIAIAEKDREDKADGHY